MEELRQSNLDPSPSSNPSPGQKPPLPAVARSVESPKPLSLQPEEKASVDGKAVMSGDKGSAKLIRITTKFLQELADSEKNFLASAERLIETLDQKNLEKFSLEQRFELEVLLRPLKEIVSAHKSQPPDFQIQEGDKDEQIKAKVKRAFAWMDTINIDPFAVYAGRVRLLISFIEKSGFQPPPGEIMAQFRGDVIAAVQRYPKFDIFPNEFFGEARKSNFFDDQIQNLTDIRRRIQKKCILMNLQSGAIEDREKKEGAWKKPLARSVEVLPQQTYFNVVVHLAINRLKDPDLVRRFKLKVSHARDNGGAVKFLRESIFNSRSFKEEDRQAMLNAIDGVLADVKKAFKDTEMEPVEELVDRAEVKETPRHNISVRKEFLMKAQEKIKQEHKERIEKDPELKKKVSLEYEERRKKDSAVKRETVKQDYIAREQFAAVQKDPIYLVVQGWHNVQLDDWLDDKTAKIMECCYKFLAEPTSENSAKLLAHFPHFKPNLEVNPKKEEKKPAGAMPIISRESVQAKFGEDIQPILERAYCLSKQRYREITHQADFMRPGGIASLTREAKESARMQQALQDELDALLSIKGGQNEMMTRLDSDSKALRVQKKWLESENSRLVEKQGELEKENDDMQRQVTSLQLDKAQLQVQHAGLVRNKDEEVQTMSAEVRRLTQVNSKLREEQSALSQERDQVVEEQKQAREENVSLTQQLVKKAEEAKRMAELQEQNVALQKQVEDKAASAGRMAELQSRNAALQKQIEDSKVVQEQKGSQPLSEKKVSRWGKLGIALLFLTGLFLFLSGVLLLNNLTLFLDLKKMGEIVAITVIGAGLTVGGAKLAYNAWSKPTAPSGGSAADPRPSTAADNSGSGLDSESKNDVSGRPSVSVSSNGQASGSGFDPGLQAQISRELAAQTAAQAAARRAGQESRPGVAL